jgi:glucose-1-phosphate adenylyltransferase
MPAETSPNFGVIEVDKDNQIRGFQEKPQTPKTIPNDPSRISASMGIYLFNTDTLLGELEIMVDSVDQKDHAKQQIKTIADELKLHLLDDTELSKLTKELESGIVYGKYSDEAFPYK